MSCTLRALEPSATNNFKDVDYQTLLPYPFCIIVIWSVMSGFGVLLEACFDAGRLSAWTHCWSGRSVEDEGSFVLGSVGLVVT